MLNLTYEPCFVSDSKSQLKNPVPNQLTLGRMFVFRYLGIVISLWPLGSQLFHEARTARSHRRRDILLCLPPRLVSEEELLSGGRLGNAILLYLPVSVVVFRGDLFHDSLDGGWSYRGFDLLACGRKRMISCYTAKTVH